MLSFSVTPSGALPSLPLDPAISEDYINCANSVGLNFHILESGHEGSAKKPLVLFLHGYPELAYSWRKVMPALASAGYHCVAVDQRGYGRTSGSRDAPWHETSLHEYSLLRYASDMVALVYALGYNSVKCLVGHDMGAAVAATCALGVPNMPAVRKYADSGKDEGLEPESDPNIHAALAQLSQPRKHYKWYNATPEAADHWNNPQQGLGQFLRGYFHLKSGNCESNTPFSLKSWTATEVAKMPNYYVMPLHSSMPEMVAEDMANEPNPYITQEWLSDEELGVYEQEWARTGFQEALNFYRVVTNPDVMREMKAFAGARISIPCEFLSGDRDWGKYQDPGALEKMSTACSDFRGIKTIRGAGHWSQQEQPGQVVAEILSFIWQVENPRLRAPMIKTNFASESGVQSPGHKLAATPQRAGYAHDSARLAPQSPPAWKSAPSPALSPPPVSAPLTRSEYAYAQNSAAAAREKVGRERVDTPIVGPSRRPGGRNFWDDQLPLPLRSRAESSGTASERAREASDRNHETYQAVMEKTHSELNKDQRPFETTRNTQQRK